MNHSVGEANATPHTPYDVWGVLVEEVAANGGRHLWGLSLGPSIQGYRLILKADRGGLPEVAYLYSTDLRGLMTLALENHRAGTLKWYRDKYPPATSGRFWTPNSRSSLGGA